MRIRKNEIEVLKKWGYNEQDIEQIQDFANHMEYYLEDDERIGVREAMKLMDSRLEWLSGAARATFHYTAYRNCVVFDSSKYWKKIMSEN